MSNNPPTTPQYAPDAKPLLSEAPFSWNVAAIHLKTGAREQFTVRGYRWIDIVDGINQIRTYWENQGYAPVVDGSIRATDAKGAVIPQTQGFPPPPEEPTDDAFPGTAPTQAAPQPTQNVNVLEINRLVIKPQPDGKTEVEFWKTGRKYAELKAKMMPESLAKMFAPLGKLEAKHFQKAADVTINMNVTWEPSKNVNSRGEPYKNVTSVAKAT